jgi:hypothetical protein
VLCSQAGKPQQIHLLLPSVSSWLWAKFSPQFSYLVLFPHNGCKAELLGEGQEDEEEHDNILKMDNKRK